MTQREASASEKAALGGLGALSETIRMRAMAQRPGAAGGDEPLAVLTELKGVDAAYPLYGTLALRHGSYRAPLPPDQILIGVALAARLGGGPADRQHGRGSWRARGCQD